MIPDEVIEEVRAHADVVDVIGEFVSLKRAGKDYKALCPFHEERTPSFFVVPSKGFYNCFGCGASGDAFAFLMNHAGLDFIAAVKHVGARAGIEVREVVARGGEENPYRSLHEANAFAAKFYRDQLRDEDAGTTARRYLDSRGIGPETIERFGLGYAPDDWRSLRNAAAKHGIGDETLLEVGLLTESERSREPYDRFRSRIIFPIESATGRVVAFGGRVLGEEGKGKPKYLNSPETPVYRKGDILYGLSRAKNVIRREEGALLVEGYLDVASLAAGGIENVVAPLGTSVTEAQAALLARYSRRVYILFDSDPAGLRATFRSGDILLEAGLHPEVVTLPPGEDPDTVMRKEGAEGVRRYLGQAVDILERKLGILDERDYFSSIEKTRDAVDRLLPTMRSASDPALKDIYVAKVAERTGVRRETLEAELSRRSGGRSPARGSGKGREVRRPRSTTPAKVPEMAMGAERALLHLLLKDPERLWLHRAVERVGAEDFEDPAYRSIFQALLDDPKLSGAPAGMEAAAAARLEELLADREEISHTQRIFEESVGRILRRHLEKRYEEGEIRLSEEEDETTRRALMEELIEIKRKKGEGGEDWHFTARKMMRTGNHNGEEHNP